MLGQNSLEFRTIIHTSPMDRQARYGLAELLGIRLMSRDLSPIERGLNLLGGDTFEGLNQNVGAFVRQEDTNIYDPQGLSGQPGPTWRVPYRIHPIRPRVPILNGAGRQGQPWGNDLEPVVEEGEIVRNPPGQKGGR